MYQSLFAATSAHFPTTSRRSTAYRHHQYRRQYGCGRAQCRGGCTSSPLPARRRGYAGTGSDDAERPRSLRRLQGATIALGQPVSNSSWTLHETPVHDTDLVSARRCTSGFSGFSEVRRQDHPWATSTSTMPAETKPSIDPRHKGVHDPRSPKSAKGIRTFAKPTEFVPMQRHHPRLMESPKMIPPRTCSPASKASPALLKLPTPRAAVPSLEPRSQRICVPRPQAHAVTGSGFSARMRSHPRLASGTRTRQ